MAYEGALIVEMLAGVSGAGLLATVGSTIYFAVKHARAVEHAANVQIAAAHVEGELTRLVYELEVTNKALDSEKRRTTALQEILDDASTAPIDLGLSPADWRGRLVRITQAWGGAAEVRVPANGERDELPAQPTAEPPKATPMSPIGDVLR